MLHSAIDLESCLTQLLTLGHRLKGAFELVHSVLLHILFHVPMAQCSWDTSSQLELPLVPAYAGGAC